MEPEVELRSQVHTVNVDSHIENTECRTSKFGLVP